MKITKQARLFSLVGFCNAYDLYNSLVRPTSALQISTFAVTASTIEYIFGLKLFAFTALVILLIVELLTGLFAAKVRGRRLTSRRMQRFGIMLLIWCTLLMVMNAFIDQYRGEGGEAVFRYLHTLVVFYILGVYTKSVLENAETIWKHRINLSRLIKRMFNSLDKP